MFGYEDLVWQDIVLTIGQFFFVFALIPMVVGNEKPPLSTSLVNGSVLSTFGFTFWSLELLFSAISVFTVSFVWFILAWQRYRRT